MKKLLIAASLTLAACSAMASTGGDSNWAIRAGVVFPRVSGLSVDTGAVLGVSYRFLNKDIYSVEVEAQGSAYRVSDSVDSATASISNLNVLGLAWTPDGKWFGGGVLGASRVSLSSGNVSIHSETKAVYGFVAGYKFTKQLSLEGRYLFSEIPGSRGTQVLVGYRF